MQKHQQPERLTGVGKSQLSLSRLESSQPLLRTPGLAEDQQHVLLLPDLVQRHFHRFHAADQCSQATNQEAESGRSDRAHGGSEARGGVERRGQDSFKAGQDRPASLDNHSGGVQTDSVRYLRARPGARAVPDRYGDPSGGDLY